MRIAGVLKECKAIGWYIEEYGQAQVSINLTDYKITNIHQAFDECCKSAERRGMRVTGSELVGLIPLDALLDAGRFYLKKQNRSLGVSEEELIRAQRYLIGSHNIDLQRKSSICQSLLLDTIYGLNYRESLDVAEKYFAVTRENVQSMAKKIFSQKCVTVLVGPQSAANATNKTL